MQLLKLRDVSAGMIPFRTLSEDAIVAGRRRSQLIIILIVFASSLAMQLLRFEGYLDYNHRFLHTMRGCSCWKLKRVSTITIVLCILSEDAIGKTEGCLIYSHCVPRAQRECTCWNLKGVSDIIIIVCIIGVGAMVGTCCASPLYSWVLPSSARMQL